MNDNKKKLIEPIIIGITLILINIRIGTNLLGNAVPEIVVVMGLFFPLLITTIVIIVIISRILEIKEGEKAINFSGLSILVAEDNKISKKI